jgi:peptidoglycan/LPS O-acetylase OafA/YrhL
MRGQHIRALTGIRFFAALWVVLYHVSRHNFDLLAEHHHGLFHAVFPVVIAGTRGVDLFFVLSGFVLALTYMERLGAGFDVRAAGAFLWLRLARVWPLYLLVLLGAAGLRVVRHQLWGSADVAPLTWVSFVRQALMVQQWFPPARGPANWVGPAWSLSAEWLAYLLFPVVVLAVARLHHGLRARTLFALAALVMLPLVVGITLREAMGGWVWLPRILCEFSAGMLLCAGASRLSLSDRVRRRAGHLALACVAAVVLWLYAVRWLALPSYAGLYVVVLFVPLVACLAIGTGPLHDLLATRALVLGGGLSYALYLVHSPLLYLFRDVTHYTGALYLPPLQRVYAELVFLPVLVAVAWALYRFVEEPARRALRSVPERLVRPAATPVPPPAEDRRAEDRRDPVRRTP